MRPDAMWLHRYFGLEEHARAASFPRVLVVGPTDAARGGISTVIRLHRRTRAWKTMSCRFLSTYQDGSAFRKVVTALWAYCAAPFRIMRADLVHLHLAGEVSLLRKLPIALCAKALNKPFIAHVHASSPDSLFSRTPKYAFRFLLGSARRVVALSESWAAAIRHHVPTAAITVLPNPVLSFPSPEKREQVETPPTILFVGRLEARKGYQDLLRAAALVLPSYPAARFLFAGHGAVEHARALAEELGILSSVNLLGWVSEPELATIYRGATLFCLPSYNEGLPMSVLEAMSHHLPVICTAVGGLPELIRHRQNGLFAIPGDPVSIADAIISLIADRGRAAQIARAGAASVQQACGLEVVSDKLLALYANALRFHHRS